MDRQMGGQADASTEQWEWYLHSKKAGWLTRHTMPTYKVPLGQVRVLHSRAGGRRVAGAGRPSWSGCPHNSHGM